jgi:putative sporulation protein YtxC
MGYLSVDLATSIFQEGLVASLKNLRDQEGLPFNIFELAQGKRYRVRCEFLYSEESKDRTAAWVQLYFLAKVLAETIICIWEKTYSKKMLLIEYGIAYEETEEVLEKISSFESNKRETLIKSFLEYFRNNSYLDLDGFMNFRAHEYKAQYRQMLSKAVIDFKREQEHKSFIKLMQRFMKSQKPFFDTLDLVVSEDKILIFDEDSQDLLGDHSNEYYEDTVLSALLKFAPRKIIIHLSKSKYPNFLFLIKEIFEGRVSYCLGCTLCLDD